MAISDVEASWKYRRPQSHHQLDATLNGRPTPLGCITSNSAASSTNASTALPFAEEAPYLKGKTLLLAPQAAGRFLPLRDASGTVSAAAGTVDAGVPLYAGERIIFVMEDADTHLGWIAASGTSTLEVWELT